MEYSLFMIKPCAYEDKNEILDIISKKLNILFTRDIVLDERLLDKLYKNEENIQFKNMNTEFLKDGKACMGIVSGRNAVQDLIKICGKKPLGSQCDKETIRYQFSPKDDIINLNGKVFFLNAIHKSDPSDAVDDVVFFLSEFMKEELEKSNIDFILKDEKKQVIMDNLLEDNSPEDNKHEDKERD